MQKGKQSNKNNSLAIKQSERPFSSSSRVIDNILSDILWAIFYYWNSYHVGEVNHKHVDNHRLTGIRGLMMLTPN